MNCGLYNDKMTKYLGTVTLVKLRYLHVCSDCKHTNYPRAFRTTMSHHTTGENLWLIF